MRGWLSAHLSCGFDLATSEGASEAPARDFACGRYLDDSNGHCFGDSLHQTRSLSACGILPWLDA